jgi:hypothetical protein
VTDDSVLLAGKRRELTASEAIALGIDPALLDFRNFLYLVWEHLGLPAPTTLQYDIASYLQKGPRRRIIEAFRGVGKSFITGAYVCWRLLLNPQLKFLVISASKDRADAFSIFVKRIIAEMPILQHLTPREDQRDSNIAFDVGPATIDQSPSVKSVGITGQITGSRADEIIADDVESLNNSATVGQRLKLSEQVKEFDAVLKPGGTITYLGTPQNEFSLYTQLTARGYELRVWPARIPAADKLKNYGLNLAPIIAKLIDDGAATGSPTDPRRFNELDLNEREASYGRSGFAMQFMLDTTLSDAERYPLKLMDLIVMALNPTEAPAKVVWAPTPKSIISDVQMVGLAGDNFYRPMEVVGPFSPYTGTIMSIDPSGRGKDETGYAIVKVKNGILYLLAAGGFQGGYEPATLQALAVLAKRFEVNQIVCEDNFGDGMFTALLQPVVSKVHPCFVEEVHSTGQKERRIIDTLEPVMNQHRLVVDEAVVRNDYQDGDPRKTLFYQMSRLTKDRGALAHDDRIEALALAVQFWVDSMRRDIDQAVKDEESERLMDYMEDFIGTVFGQVSQNGTISRAQTGQETPRKPTGWLKL